MKIERANKIVEEVEDEEEHLERAKYYHEDNCEISQLAKYDRNPQKQPLSKTYTPRRPFQQLHRDLLFMDGRILLTIVEHFSKYAQAYTYHR